MPDGFRILERAVAKGFDSLSKYGEGAPKDSDLALYEKMTPDTLNVIAETYGPDNLVKYVQAMEAKRVRAATRGE